jgi:acyl-CoA reductase-like NAD-dependent aldehyde dehydrogenase
MLRLLQPVRRVRIVSDIWGTDAFFSIKESGWGKEGGAEAILDFCKVKAVIVGGGK